MSADKPCPNVALFRDLVAREEERRRAAGEKPIVMSQAQKDDLERANPAFGEAMRFLRTMGLNEADLHMDRAEALLDEALGPDHAAFVVRLPSNMQ
jgi:hypothetical protein